MTPCLARFELVVMMISEAAISIQISKLASPQFPKNSIGLHRPRDDAVGSIHESWPFKSFFGLSTSL